MELVRTPRLLLRDWEPDDLPAYFDIYSRWEVMRWLGAQPRSVVPDREEAARRLERWRGVTDPPFGLWAIVPVSPIESGPPDRPSPRAVSPARPDSSARAGPLGVGVPVGTALLLPLRDADGPTGDVEVGWHLHPDAQGRGLATEAARALLALAALPRVLALTDQDNTASQAVATRLGMADEGLTDRWFGIIMRQYATAPADR